MRFQPDIQASSILLSFVLAAAGIGACSLGSSAAPGTTSLGAPVEEPGVNPDKADGGAVSVDASLASDAAHGSDDASMEAAAEPVGAMKPIVASTMAATLMAAGIDLTNLPKLDDVVQDEAKLHAVMGSFAKSLGVGCDNCHAAKAGTGDLDFGAETPEKNIAKGMWEKFVGDLAFSDGSPLYCDSCHQGSKAILNRTDDKAVGAWMHANFVGKLTSRDSDAADAAAPNAATTDAGADTDAGDAAAHDGGVHDAGAPGALSCTSCHGKPFNPTFLDNWAAGK